MATSTKVLLTGGAGFIGSHVAEALVRRGVQLTILDSLDNFYFPAWKRANLEDVRRAGEFAFEETDICDEQATRRIFDRRRLEVVIHLAARAGVRPSIEQPRLYERVNLGGTANLLELCKEFGVPRFLFGSSSSVYGDGATPPFSESEANLFPISPYAATKIGGEMLCRTYAHLTGMTVLCLRFFTVYGPRQRPDLAIHKFTALLEAGKPLPVFGDGSTGRDYTYVDDIVAGVLAALDYSPASEGKAPFDILNLGNSHPVSLNEMIAALERATGKTASRKAMPLQPGDVSLTWADISKPRRLLGFEPSTPFRQGVEKFVAWYRAADPKRRA
jgi:UDP-glucuronate 4-epimerase